MRHTIRNLLYVLACAVPASGIAAGLGEPVNNPDDYTDLNISAFVAELYAACSDEPLTCRDDPDFITQGLAGVVIDVEAAARADCKQDTASCNITISDVVGSAGFGETEPNDSAGSADQLTRDVPSFGQLSSAVDIDWYRINTLANNTAMLISIAESTSTWRVSVRDTQRNVLANFLTEAGTENDFLVQASNVGVQYITIEASNVPTSAQYEMTVALIHAQGGTGQPVVTTLGETEPNNAIYSADVLQRNQTVVGQSYGTEDIDWYQIETTRNNTFLEFRFEDSLDSWHAEFTDSAGNVLSSFDTTAGDRFVYELQAPNLGKYYLKVRSLAPTSDVYRLSVVYLDQFGGSPQPDYNQFDVERENNDLFTRADNLGNLTTTVEVRGQLITYDDIDLFRIDSPGGNEYVTVEICPEGSVCANDEIDHWNVYVFDGATARDSMLNARTIGGGNGPLFLDQSLYDSCRLPGGVQPSPSPAPTPTPDNTTATCESEDVPGFLSFTTDQLHFLAVFGTFGDTLLGMIDFTSGDDRIMRFAIQDPGTYYIGVSTMLTNATEPGWRVVQRQDEVQYKPDPLYIEHLNYSSDQYTLRVTRSELTPTASNLDFTTGHNNGGGSSGGSSSNTGSLLRRLPSFK